ncbi:MAG: MinD/ParA family protein [Pseudomonadota bacterium]|nr:MAG: MinD/ParA family protein [Pseudomonadota bacterium]
MAEVFSIDHSTALRRDAHKPVRVIAVTGGKGGVGKTNVSVNLAMALADSGKQVMIMDADLGLGNIDVMLGLNPKLTLQHVIDGSRSLEDVMVEGPKGVRIVPAASGVQRMAELSPGEHGALIRAFSELSFDVDVLLVDTAAGISDSVVSFTRAAQDVVVVVCDEPASITDAYALIKLLNREQGVFRFRVLVNMASNARQAREVYEKIARVSDRFLDVALDYMGHVPRDDFLVSAIRKQRAVVEAFPHSNAAAAFRSLIEKVDNWPLPVAAGGHMEFFFERLIDGNMHETEVMP